MTAEPPLETAPSTDAARPTSTAFPTSTALSVEGVLSILAAFGDRGPVAAQDAIGSLELTWLITEVEQRHGAVLELTDAQLAAVRTVDDAASVLNAALGSLRSGAAGA